MKAMSDKQGADSWHSNTRSLVCSWDKTNHAKNGKHYKNKGQELDLWVWAESINKDVWCIGLRDKDWSSYEHWIKRKEGLEALDPLMIMEKQEFN